MIITNKLTMDLQHPGTTPIISAVQCDSNSRNLEIAITSGRKPFCLPQDSRVIVRFRKSDGTGGEYDTLPGGDLAWSIRQNLLTVSLVPQVFTFPGSVSLSVSLLAADAQISAFPISIYVTPVAFAKPAKSENYFYVTGFLNAPAEAAVGQYLKVSATNEAGRITATEAAIPTGSGGPEQDPSVPDWAKQPQKPAYTAQEVHARPDTWLPTADEIGAEPIHTVTAHNGDPDAHADLRNTVQQLHNAVMPAEIPEYWQEHLDSKIAAIHALQDAGGKDAFSFIVMTDSHMPTNLGKHSPLLAAHIASHCDIPYILYLGDIRTRGLQNTKDDVMSEFDSIESFFAPVRGRLLQTQGNHDSGYGSGDTDGDGINDSYAYELTKGELHRRIYRRNGLVSNCQFDDSGTGFYFDDTAGKVRFIVLNSHNNSPELNENGTVKYSAMRHFRFGQSQYNLVIQALSTIPDDTWHVAVFSHVPLDKSGEYSAWGEASGTMECSIMKELLTAYREKTACMGEFDGLQGGGTAYHNLFDAAADGYKAGYRFGSGGNESQDSGGAVITNYIPFNAAMVGAMLHIKGIKTSVNGGTTYCRIVTYDADKNQINVVQLPTASDNFTQSSYDETVAVWKLGYGNGSSTVEAFTDSSAAYFRIGGYYADSATNIVVTVDEAIQDSAQSYDAVSVDVDCSSMKGQLIGFFAGHAHIDSAVTDGIPIITTRCDAAEEGQADLKAERIAGTVTEQSFDVFTVNTKDRKIHATKIGAGADRVIPY